jgi:hypothetical protein
MNYLYADRLPNWQPELPSGIELIDLFSTAAEIAARMREAGLSQQLSEVLEDARIYSRRHQMYAASTAFVTDALCYGLTITQAAEEHDCRVDLAIFAFEPEQSERVCAIVSRLLLERGDHILLASDPDASLLEI